MAAQIFRGTVVHSLELGKIQFFNEAVIKVNISGKIEFCCDINALPNASTWEELLNNEVKNGTLIHDHRDKLIIPGFIDGHTHAPQAVFAGTGMDLPLMKWLEKQTFPAEAKFKDVEYAKEIYRKVVERHLRNGTTTCSYFGTIHLEATKALVDAVREFGQRAFVGKVNMDRNSPDFLIEATDESISNTEAFIQYVLQSSEITAKCGENVMSIGNLVAPVITPRFVPTCSAELLEGLGNLSLKYNLPIQSHLSETVNEVEFVKMLHPECESYSEVYNKFKLFNGRSYYSHCIHCSESEKDLMRMSGCNVIHCPTSNFMIRSGVCNVKDYLKRGIKVGLGTDVAGGYSFSILDSIRKAIVASNVLSMEGKMQGNPLTSEEAFHLATQGGADAIGIGNLTGNFLQGKFFDALVIDVKGESRGKPSLYMPFDLYGDQGMKVAFEKFLFLGDDRNIKMVYVNGQRRI